MYTATFYGETLAERTAPPMPDEEKPLSAPETVDLKTLVPSCESLSEFSGTATVQLGSFLLHLESRVPIPKDIYRDVLNQPAIAFRLQKQSGDHLRFELSSAPPQASLPSVPLMATKRASYATYAAAASTPPTKTPRPPTPSPLRVVEVEQEALLRVFHGATLESTPGKQICATLRRAMAHLYPNIFVRVVSRDAPFTTAHVQVQHRDLDTSVLCASTDFQRTTNGSSFEPTAERTLVVLICKPSDHSILASAGRAVRSWLLRPRLPDIVVKAGECSGASYKELTDMSGDYSLQPVFVLDCRSWNENRRQYERCTPLSGDDFLRLVGPLDRTRVRVLVLLNATRCAAVTAVRGLCTEQARGRSFDTVAFWHDDAPGLAVVDAAVHSDDPAFASYVLKHVVFLDICSLMDTRWRKRVRERFISALPATHLEYLLNVCADNHSRYFSCMNNLYPAIDDSDDQSDSD